MDTRHLPLPRHPRTGLQALGWSKRGPIWPVVGGDGTGDGGTGDGGTGGGNNTGGNNTGGGNTGGGNGSDKTFTQADLDRIVQERLARAKPADYDDLKAKAAKFDEFDAANKTEAQKLAEERDKLAVDNAALTARQVRLDAVLDAGLTKADAEFITAVDPAEAKAQAEKLAERLKPQPTGHDQGHRGGGGEIKASVARGRELYEQRKTKKT